MSEEHGQEHSRRRTVIGLLGQYSSRNLGDAAIVHEITRNLRSRIPRVEFVGICSRPDDTVQTQDIAAFPISGHGEAFRADSTAWTEVDPPLGPAAGTRRIDRVVRSLDLLVMAGGGQVDDYWGGAGQQPRFLATWTLLARLRRVPTAYFCVGLDQLATRSGRWLALLGLRGADFLSFRDEGTRELLRRLGLRKPSTVYADPAFSVEVPARTDMDPRGRVLVSPICRRSWPGATEAQYERYQKELARYCEALIVSGLSVRFACSQISMDPEAAAQVSGRIDQRWRTGWSLADVATFPDFVREAADADLVVTSRLHGAILGFVAGTPVMAVSVARKVNAVMADMGLAAYCLEAGDITAGRLVTLTKQALGEAAALRPAIRSRVERTAAKLPSAYDVLADLVRRDRRA